MRLLKDYPQLHPWEITLRDQLYNLVVFVVKILYLLHLQIRYQTDKSYIF